MGVNSSSDRIVGLHMQADSLEEYNEKQAVVINNIKILDVDGNDIMRRDLLPKLD